MLSTGRNSAALRPSKLLRPPSKSWKLNKTTCASRHVYRIERPKNEIASSRFPPHSLRSTWILARIDPEMVLTRRALIWGDAITLLHLFRYLLMLTRYKPDDSNRYKQVTQFQLSSLSLPICSRIDLIRSNVFGIRGRNMVEWPRFSKRS